MQDVRQRLILLEASGAGGVAVYEHPTDTGPADYVLFVKRIAVGVIEAKRDEAGEKSLGARGANRALRQSSQVKGEGADTLELSPFADQVNLRFQAWIFRHNAQHATAFTPEQTDWLRLMKDHIAAQGGLQKVWSVFGSRLDELRGEMNEALVA